MAIASLFGGLALANAGLGAVHGFAGPFGGMFPAPYGAVCARLLPHVMEANVGALQRRSNSSNALRRHDQVAQILTGELDATALDGVNWVRELRDELNVLPLTSYGFTAGDIATLAEKAAVASSMKGNPIDLTREDMHGILEQAA